MRLRRGKHDNGKATNQCTPRRYITGESSVQVEHKVTMALLSRYGYVVHESRTKVMRPKRPEGLCRI